MKEGRQNREIIPNFEPRQTCLLGFPHVFFHHSLESLTRSSQNQKITYCPDFVAILCPNPLPGVYTRRKCRWMLSVKRPPFPAPEVFSDGLAFLRGGAPDDSRERRGIASANGGAPSVILGDFPPPERKNTVFTPYRGNSP